MKFSVLLAVCLATCWGTAYSQDINFEQIRKLLVNENEEDWQKAVAILAAKQDLLELVDGNGSWSDLNLSSVERGISSLLHRQWRESNDPEHVSMVVQALAGLMSHHHRRQRFGTGGGMFVSGFVTFPSARIPLEPDSFRARFVSHPDPLARAAALKYWRLSYRREFRMYGTDSVIHSTELPLAVKLLTDPSPAVRVQAIHFIKRFGLSGETINEVNHFRMRELFADGNLPDPEFYGQPRLLTRDMIIDKICSMIRDDLAAPVRMHAIRAAVAFNAERAADSVLRSLHDVDPDVRHTAAIAAGLLRLYDAADRLIELLDDKSEIVTSWGFIPVPGQVGPLGLNADSDSGMVAGSAIWALGELGDSRPVLQLHLLLNVPAEGRWVNLGSVSAYMFPKGWFGFEAARALANIGHPHTWKFFEGPNFEKPADSGRSMAKQSFLRAINTTADAKYGNVFDNLANNPDGFVRQTIESAAEPGTHSDIKFHALRLIGRYHFTNELRDVLIKISEETDPVLEWGAIYFLARSRDPLAPEFAKRAIPEAPDARFFAGMALAELGRVESLDLLRPFLHSDKPHIRFLSASAMMRLDDSEAVTVLAVMGQTRGPLWYNAHLELSFCGRADAAYALENHAYRVPDSSTVFVGLSRLASEDEQMTQRLDQYMNNKSVEPLLSAELFRNSLSYQHMESLVKQLESQVYSRTLARTWAVSACVHPRLYLHLLQHERGVVRAEAIEALAESRRGARKILPSGTRVTIRIGAADNFLPEIIAATSDRVIDVRIAAVRALGFEAAGANGDEQEQVLGVLREFENSWNLKLQIESIAARARLGDKTAAPILERIIEEGPEWRQLIARAGLAALGFGEQTQILQRELIDELQQFRLHGRSKAFQIIRLLGWCKDESSIEILQNILDYPAAYDGGHQAVRLYSESRRAIWRLTEAMK